MFCCPVIICRRERSLYQRSQSSWPSVTIKCTAWKGYCASQKHYRFCWWDMGSCPHALSQKLWMTEEDHVFNKYTQYFSPCTAGCWTARYWPASSRLPLVNTSWFLHVGEAKLKTNEPRGKAKRGKHLHFGCCRPCGAGTLLREGGGTAALTLRSRWTTPIWWQCSTASRICWMQWLHANTMGAR